MTWQWVLVFLIEALALAFLVYKFALPKRPPKLFSKRRQKPDVKLSDLTRKRRETGA